MKKLILHLKKTLGHSLILFKKNTLGAVAIEFFLTIVILVVIYFFMFDYTYTRSTIGKLDNISYTVAALMRERQHLYGKDAEGKVKEKLVQADLVELGKLAKSLYYGNPNDTRELNIHIAALNFDDTPSDKRPVGKLTEFSTGKCEPVIPLKSLERYAPHSELTTNRVIPMYQFTICVKSYSLFKTFLAGPDRVFMDQFRSTSTTVGRSI